MESVKYSVNIPIANNREEYFDVENSQFVDNNNLAVINKTITVPQGYEGQKNVNVIAGVGVANFNSNGVYDITNEQRDSYVLGWHKVIINVPQGENVNNADVGTNGVITSNGQYNIPSGYTGFNSFEVALPMQSKQARFYINDNEYPSEDIAFGRYIWYKPDNEYRGLSEVKTTVYLGYKTINSNGSFSIVDNREDNMLLGWWKVDVNVPTTLVDNANVNANNNITSNGTFTVPNDKTGFNSFTVNVPQGVPTSSIENTKSITLYRNYTSEPFILKPDTNYEALRECQIYVQVPSDINNGTPGTNGVITTNGTYSVPQGKSGWNSFSVNVPQTIQGVDPLNIYFVDSGLGNHPFHDYMYHENTTGEYIYLEPSQYAELWIKKSNGDVEFVVYYYKGTGSRYPLTNDTSCYYQRYTPEIPPLSQPNTGDTVVFKDDVNGDTQLTINWYERYFSGTNMPGLLTASITFPSALIGNTIQIPSWLIN